MASNAFSEITEEFLVCQICLEDFRQPKVLPCLHTFCQPCLERLLATEPVGKISCPTCRQDVPLPENGVQGLKSNFLVGKLHDILQQQPKRKGEASKPRANGVPYLQSGRFAAELRARETSKCEDHNEINKFYCDTCHRVICLHCVVTAHKDHQYMEIETVVERERAKIKAKLPTVKNTADLHKKWIEELQSVKDDWPLQVQRTEEQIDKQAKAIIEAVEKVKSEKISQLRAMNAAREKKMEAAMEAAEMNLASARSCVQFTDHVLEYGSPAEVMSVAGELTARMEQTADKKDTQRVELINSLTILNFDPPAGKLEQDIAKLIGEIKETKMLRSNTQSSVRPNLAVGTCGGSPKFLKTVGDYELEEEPFNYLTSLAVTADGDIVVTDTSTKRLQFLDEVGYLERVHFRFTPWCVAVMPNGELLVTGDGHKIHVLDKQGKESGVIQVTGAVEKNRKTEGVAVDGLGRIIVTIGYQVFILSPNGDAILTFGEKCEDGRQSSSSLRVAVNSSNQIIISDCYNHNLKIFDATGRYLITCGSRGSGPGQLDYPFCVITDREDNIIVAENNNHRVSLFSRDGTFIRHVLTQEEHNLNFPKGLMFTLDGHLVVSDTNSIKIFTM
ncbi:tripartite motif-containing protein 2-like [Branchiostoma lanceolatum]|uniref:tripartite motif-containing protein 2-like n=1 Tax=Branchiostoma lanceolatum TaxID=7740 RepID=UPI003454FF2B